MQDSTDQLIAVLQARNTAMVAITRDNVTFEDVRPATGSGYNTTATLTAVEGYGFTGNTQITWSRVDLGLLLDGSGLLSDGDLSAQDVVDKINANWATWLTLNDLQSFTPPTTADGGIHDLLLTASSASLGFMGQVTMSLSRSDMSTLDTTLNQTLSTAFGALA